MRIPGAVEEMRTRGGQQSFPARLLLLLPSKRKGRGEGGVSGRYTSKSGISDEVGFANSMLGLRTNFRVDKNNGLSADHFRGDSVFRLNLARLLLLFPPKRVEGEGREGSVAGSLFGIHHGIKNHEVGLNVPWSGFEPTVEWTRIISRTKTPSSATHH